MLFHSVTIKTKTCMIHVGCPRILRTDRGTENTHIAFIQPTFRHSDPDDFAGMNSHWYGRSTSNQVCFITNAIKRSSCLLLCHVFDRELSPGGDSSEKVSVNGGYHSLRYDTYVPAHNI